MPPPRVGTWSKPIIDASENDSVRHTVWNCDPLITHLCLLREVAGRNCDPLITHLCLLREVLSMLQTLVITPRRGIEYRAHDQTHSASIVELTGGQRSLTEETP